MALLRDPPPRPMPLLLLQDAASQPRAARGAPKVRLCPCCCRHCGGCWATWGGGPSHSGAGPMAGPSSPCEGRRRAPQRHHDGEHEAVLRQDGVGRVVRDVGDGQPRSTLLLLLLLLLLLPPRGRGCVRSVQRRSSGP